MTTSLVETIGNTALVELKRFARASAFPGRILVKTERQNPFGSVKDRAALAMVEAAVTGGRLRPGGVIVEPTSGNTGIALAGVGRALGYRVILTMPETMSVERRDLLSAQGAELVLTDGKAGMAGAIARAREIAASLPEAFMPDQFANPANALAHYRTTGPELRDACIGAGFTDGPDIFVAGVGTGGTITGVGRFLRERRPDVRIYAVEPAGSPVLSGGKAGPHGLQGIGAGFVPEVLDTAIYDAVVTIQDDEAHGIMREVALQEGMLIGVSGAAALMGALRLVELGDVAGKTVAVILPDSGERYMSLGIFPGATGGNGV